MSDEWQHQLRIYLPAELVEVARADPIDLALGPLTDILSRLLLNDPRMDCSSPFCSVRRGWAASVGQAVQACLGQSPSCEQTICGIARRSLLRLPIRGGDSCDARHLARSPGGRGTLPLPDRPNCRKLGGGSVQACRKPGSPLGTLEADRWSGYADRA